MFDVTVVYITGLGTRHLHYLCRRWVDRRMYLQIAPPLTCHPPALLSRTSPAPFAPHPRNQEQQHQQQQRDHDKIFTVSSKTCRKLRAPAAGTPAGRAGGGGGGPCIRFEGITLELSSFSGCQFDFGKSGNLVLSFDAFTGTVTLQGTSSHSTPKIRSDGGEERIGWTGRPSSKTSEREKRGGQGGAG